MTKPLSRKNGVVCSHRLTWYRRENLPCLRQLQLANRGFIERVIETIWDLQVDRSGFKCFDFTSEELAYQLAMEEEDIKRLISDRRTAEALEQIRSYMEAEYRDGLRVMNQRTGEGDETTPEGDPPAPQAGTLVPPQGNVPTPQPGWDDTGWSQIYLDAREEIKAIWPKTYPGVVNDLRFWVATFSGLTDVKKVEAKHREEWIPRILEILTDEDEDPALCKDFKSWMMRSGAGVKIKALAGTKPNEVQVTVTTQPAISEEGFAEKYATTMSFDDPDQELC